MNLISHIGDTRAFSIPLSWGGRPFVPGSDWNLIFTAKTSVSIPDSERLLQKQTSGLGITVAGQTASIEILRADTFREEDYPETGDAAFEADAGDYVWDIKATRIADGETRTVASGTLSLTRPVGLATTATGPIYVVEDPLATVSPNVDNAAYDAATWDGVTELVPSKNALRDKFVSVDAAVAGKQPLDADLTNYAGAADSAARRALIGAAGTALEITTALQGAALDATKIGAEYMPEELSVEGVVLGQQGEIIQETVGMLIRNGDMLAISDSDTAGGNLVYDLTQCRKLTYIPAATYAADARVVIGSVFVPASKAVIGSHLVGVVDLRVSCNGGSLPVDSVFGIVTETRKLLSGNTLLMVVGSLLNNVVEQHIHGWEIGATITNGGSGNVQLDTQTFASSSIKPITNSGSGSQSVGSAIDGFTNIGYGTEEQTTPAGEGFTVYFVLDIPASATPTLSINVALNVQMR
ncbi:MAG: hypothetical protein RLZZ214_326 [Verrucomicrobiota bacterium]|jgi:hypothetical protein